MLRDRVSVGIGHDVGHTGLASSNSDATMEIGWRLDAEGDDEELLAAEGVDDRGFVVVVHFDGTYAVRQLSTTALTSQASDGMLAGLCESFGKGTTDTTGRLQGSVSVLIRSASRGVGVGASMTYTDDGDSFDEINGHYGQL